MNRHWSLTKITLGSFHIDDRDEDRNEKRGGEIYIFSLIILAFERDKAIRIIILCTKLCTDHYSKISSA